MIRRTQFEPKMTKNTTFLIAASARDASSMVQWELIHDHPYAGCITIAQISHRPGKGM